MPIIQATNLEKEFRRPKRIEGLFGGIQTFFTREFDVTRAVDDVSFSIDEGELVGYLGSNGAGKSTTIKMLSGILVPSGGEVTVAGLSPWEDRERNALNIGVVFGQRTQLWWDLPLGDSLRLISKLYRMDRARYERNLARMVDVLGLEPFLQTPVRQLSLGQRMRGDLAAAMLYEPRILFLDEPTVGLDVVAKERVRQFVEEINRDTGTTIMLTTHDLADVERLCKRIIFIDKGRVLFDGAVAELKRRYAPHRELHVTLDPTIEPPAGVTIMAPGVEMGEPHEGQLIVRFDPAQIAVTDLIPMVTSRYAIIDIAIEEPALEGVVREIVESGEVRS